VEVFYLKIKSIQITHFFHPIVIKHFPYITTAMIMKQNYKTQPE